MVTDKERYSACLAPGLNPEDASWSYCPSFPAAVTFAAIFGAVFVSHLIQAFYYKKRYCWVVCMASAWETGGFAMRALGAQDVVQVGYVAPSQLLILLSPLWVNAFVYMVVGRMIYFWLLQKKVWKIKATSMTRFFVWMDVVIFIVQVAGGSMLGAEDDPKQAKIGLNVYMAGIGFQQTILLAFVGLMISFHRQVLRDGKIHLTSWKPLLYTLYSTLALITVRIIYRLVEYSSGVEGPMVTQEHYFYTLEAGPMVIALGLLAIFHPGRYLRGEGSEFEKPLVTKGDRRWWCCGRRKRVRMYADSNNLEDASEGIAMPRRYHSRTDSGQYLTATYDS